jgi:excisionase family DNA binding protein
MTDKLLSLEEAAQRLGVSVWTVYRLTGRGRLASVRLGRRRLVSPQDLEDFIHAARCPEDGRAPGDSAERKR